MRCASSPVLDRAADAADKHERPNVAYVRERHIPPVLPSQELGSTQWSQSKAIGQGFTIFGFVFLSRLFDQEISHDWQIWRKSCAFPIGVN